LFAADAAACRVILTRGGHGLGLRDLPLEDFHTLRAILRSLGVIAEDEVELECQNCGHRWHVRPASGLELGPYRDGELNDPGLDEPFTFGEPHALDRAQTTIELRPLTLGEVEPLHLALGEDRPLRPATRLVRALGLRAIGEERDPTRLGRRLRRATDDFWEELGLLFESAHYPPRLTVPHACDRCHVVEWLEVPTVREFTVHSTPEEARANRQLAEEHESASFPTPDDFEELVRATAARVYAELGVRAVDLVVVDGPAECDDAGEPLLGAYYPADPDALPPHPPEIRIFCRTFQNLWADEGSYDVPGEVEETLRHELEHHFGELRGSDPLDDGERAEIASDYHRRVGRRESARRAVQLLSADFWGFWRKTWWVWLLVSLATLLLTWAEP
jgi:predicted Zn-dependent protease with MMP-like domain